MANDTTRQTVPISFRLSGDVAARLDVLAEADGQSRGEFVRSLVHRAVNGDGAAAHPAPSSDATLEAVRVELAELRKLYTGVDREAPAAPDSTASMAQELQILRGALVQQKQTIQQAWTRIQAELRGLKESVDTVDTDLLRKDHVALLEALKVVGGKQNALDDFQKKVLGAEVARVKQLVSVLRNDLATSVIALLSHAGSTSAEDARNWVRTTLQVED